MLYIALLLQLKPPPKEEKSQKTFDSENKEIENTIKTKAPEYIHRVRETHYLERRLFL
jgi:hypothetical protein